MIIASVGNVSKVTQEVIAWSRQGTEKHSIVYKQQLLSINIYSSHEGRDIGRMRSLGIMKFSRSRVPGTLKGIYEPCKQTSSHCFSLPFTMAVQVILMPLAFSLEPLKTCQAISATQPIHQQAKPNNHRQDNTSDLPVEMPRDHGDLLCVSLLDRLLKILLQNTEI